MEPAVVEIIGTIVIEGGKYLISKLIDEAGKVIWRAFTDEDGDMLPDDPTNPFREWDEEPEDWDPFDPVPDDPVVGPGESDTSVETQIIIVSPDGSMMIYDEAGNLSAEVADTAYSLWLSENNFLDKDFDNYSVSEGFLFLIFFALAAAVIKFFFGRRGLY